MDTFEALIGRLRAGEDVPSGGWDLLSALADDRAAVFRTLWDSLVPTDRLSLLDSLHSESEAQAHLDFTPIWRLALDDASPRVRQAGIAYSADEEGEWLLDPLLQLSANDPEVQVRAAAAEALGRFTYLAEVGALSPRRLQQLEQVLLAIVSRVEEAVVVRGNALASVGYLSTPRVHDAITTGHADPDLRQSAVRAMGRSADPNWTATLLTESTDDAAGLREEAARALGEIEDTRGVPRLLELLEDPVIAVRLAAIWALGEIGGEEAQEALIYCLDDPRDIIREAAETALEELASRDEPLTL